MSRRRVRTANPARYAGDMRRIRGALSFAMDSLGLAGPVSVALVGDAAMRELNLRYKNKKDTTDVLAFELEQDLASDPDPELGEIIVCVDTAREQAAEAGITLSREIELLALHGLLHLFGMDDARPGDRKRMQARAERILDDFDRVGSKS